MITSNMIQQVTLNYTTRSIFNQRANFKNEVESKLRELFVKSSNNILNLISTQIHFIKTEEEYENSIQSTIIQSLYTKVYEIMDKIRIINKTTEMIERNTLSDINLINLRAMNYLNSVKDTTRSSCLDLIMKNDIEVYSSLDDVLLSEEGNLINFISVIEERDYSPTQFVNINSLIVNER